MALEGMDVAAVADLARRVDAHTRTLESVAAQLGGLAAELGRCWHGPAAATFQHDCETRHRPAIAAAAGATSEMHRHLTANMAEQRLASAAVSVAGGSGAAVSVAGLAGLGMVTGAVAGGIANAWDVKEKVERAARIPEYLLNTEAKLFHHADPLTGHGPLSWLGKHTEDPVFPYYKDTKLVRWMHDTPALRTADHLLVKTHGYKILGKVVEPAAIAIGVATVGVDVSQAGYAFTHHQDGAAAGDLVNGVADGVGMVPVVGWLGQFDIEMAKKDVTMITTGGPIPSPFSWQNLKEDYAPLPGEMWHQLGKDKGELFNMLLGGHG